ncbi:unnamed protein product [Arabidopsis halleri]
MQRWRRGAERLTVGASGHIFYRLHALCAYLQCLFVCVILG